jgi:hypothetical protein
VESNLFEQDGGPYEFNRVNLRRSGFEDLSLSRVSYRAEGGDPLSLRLRCATELRARELTSFFEKGFHLYLFAIGATVTASFVTAHPGMTLSNPLKSFVDASKPVVEKRYQTSIKLRESLPTFKSGMIAEIDRNHYLEAFTYINIRRQVVLLLSGLHDTNSEKALDEVFRHITRSFDGNLSNRINQGALCGLRCPRGDVLLRSCGEFDDTYRTAEIIFDPRQHTIV